MFGFFKKKEKTEEDLLLESFKRVAKDIKKHKAGCGGICVDFGMLCQKNDLYNELGVLWQDEVPFPKINVSYAGLMLLAMLKNGIADKDEFFINAAGFSFINSVLIFTTDELRDLLAQTPEEITESKRVRKEEAIEAWARWKNEDAATLKRIFL